MKLSISLPDKLGAEIRASARERGISVSQYIAELVTDDRRRRILDEWSDEVLAKNPPTAEEVAEIQRIVDSARQSIPVRSSAG